jgi:hypothetical protein
VAVSPDGTSDTHDGKATDRLRSFKRAQFVKKAGATVLGAAGVLMTTFHSVSPAPSAAVALDGTFNAAKVHDRWTIKTSIETAGAHATVVQIPIDQLAKFPDISNPPDSKLFNDKRLTNPVNGLEEGQIVQTDGYIHLVADEDDDSDYHIQINGNPTNDPDMLTPCYIVEVPHPDAAGNPDLSARFAKVRDFIRENCFDGKAPTGTVKTPLHVRVTGQLFFDLFHAAHSTDPGGGRGKKVAGHPMHATTIWEIHPIIDIQTL